MYRPAMITGALFAGLGVVLGAFGAHALKQVLTEQLLQTFETGVRYQMYHSFALLIVGLAVAHLPAKTIRYVTLLFVAGIICFSGSLYLLAAMKANGQVGLDGIGIITPIGGLFFITAWLLLVIGLVKKQ